MWSAKKTDTLIPSTGGGGNIRKRQASNLKFQRKTRQKVTEVLQQLKKHQQKTKQDL